MDGTKRDPKKPHFCKEYAKKGRAGGVDGRDDNRIPYNHPYNFGSDGRGAGFAPTTGAARHAAGLSERGGVADNYTARS